MDEERKMQEGDEVSDEDDDDEESVEEYQLDENEKQYTDLINLMGRVKNDEDTL